MLINQIKPTPTSSKFTFKCIQKTLPKHFHTSKEWCHLQTKWFSSEQPLSKYYWCTIVMYAHLCFNYCTKSKTFSSTSAVPSHKETCNHLKIYRFIHQLIYYFLCLKEFSPNMSSQKSQMLRLTAQLKEWKTRRISPKSSTQKCQSPSMTCLNLMCGFFSFSKLFSSLYFVKTTWCRATF